MNSNFIWGCVGALLLAVGIQESFFTDKDHEDFVNRLLFLQYSFQKASAISNDKPEAGKCYVLSIPSSLRFGYLKKDGTEIVREFYAVSVASLDCDREIGISLMRDYESAVQEKGKVDSVILQGIEDYYEQYAKDYKQGVVEKASQYSMLSEYQLPKALG